MANFTPGPWIAKPRMKQAPHSFPVEAGAWTYYAQTKANANLIAAAPEMYEALKRVMENKWEPDKYHMALTEALAKADGKAGAQ